MWLGRRQAAQALGHPDLAQLGHHPDPQEPEPFDAFGPDPLVIILYFPMISVPLTVPWVLQQGVWPQGIEWFSLLGVGVMTQLGQIWVTEGLRCLPAARATSINYVQVVFAAGWGWLWFAETINAWQVGGGMLVLAATLISLSARH